MINVNSKADIKEALNRGEREFYTSNKTLLYACALVSKVKSFSFLTLGLKANMSVALAETTVIVITIAVLTTAVALYAIFKDYDIEVDIPNGRIKCRKKVEET
ncbi:MAG: hypothetical protein MJZ28_04775 [Paludibacteraceae bacterium]|nr:hypothetical protein [Paludibacteraceae bacterium]